MKENLKNVPIYTEEDLTSNEHYNEIILPQHIKTDYITSLQLYSAAASIIKRENIGSIEKLHSEDDDGNSSNNHLKWYTDAYQQMKDNLTKINKIISIRPSFFQRRTTMGDWKRNAIIEGKKFSKFINKKLDSRSNKVLHAVELNLKLIDPIQK